MKRLLAVACLSALACAPLCAARQEPGEGKESPARKQQEEEKKKEADEKTREKIMRVKAEHGAGSLPPSLRAIYKPAELPAGEGAWAVQVVTTGGIMGTGRGNVTVLSDGGVACAPPSPCAAKPAHDSLARLSQLLAEAKPSKWRVAEMKSACNDCITTLLVLQRRGPDGRAKTYAVYWDDVTMAGAPSEALRIHEAAVAVASAGN